MYNFQTNDDCRTKSNEHKMKVYETFNFTVYQYSSGSEMRTPKNGNLLRLSNVFLRDCISRALCIYK